MKRLPDWIPGREATAVVQMVWIVVDRYGRRYMGILRATFVIDGEGRIVHVFEKVKPEGHAGEVLAVLRS